MRTLHSVGAQRKTQNRKCEEDGAQARVKSTNDMMMMMFVITISARG